MGRLRRAGALLCAAAAAAGLAACGGGASGGGPLAGQSFTVGSKEFTEQMILGQIAVAALEHAGAEVKDETGLAGSVTARRALTSGDIDLYWEYTGTAWIVYLDETQPIRDSARQYRAVAERDRRRNGIAWLPYAPFDNTYAIAARRDVAERLGTRTLSDFARLARERPDEATLCVAEEFVSRDDGLPGLERAYGFELAGGRVSKLDEGLIYQQLGAGRRCNFGEVFATDGRIERNRLVLLEDDRRFFPRYNPAVAVRAEVLRRAPALRRLFGDIARRLDERTIRRLNAQVDIDGLPEEEVAEEWLEQEGLIR